MQFNPDNQDFQGEQEWDGPRSSFMVKLVMKTGLVQDESQANYVLIGIAVVFFVLTVMVFAGIDDNPPVEVSGPPESLPPVEILRALTPEELAEWGTPDDFTEWGVEI